MREVIRTVGRYEILAELGRGGMAVVHLARHTDLDRHVALKELAAFRAGDPALVQRFVREARLAASLTHANIVTVHDFFEHDGLPYIAMELVERGTLRPYMGQMSLVQILGVLEGMLDGLGHAAVRGLVHRDVKPENVLVGADGRVKIADFGIARARDRLWGSTLTDPGVAVGTPAYMAPEQATAAEIGPWTDLYAVGAVAFEMVSGRLPFAAGPSPAAALLRLVAEPAPSPSAVAPGLDAGIAGWIESMLARDPAQRPPDAAAAWTALEQHAIRLFGVRWRRQAPLVGGATTRGVAALAPGASAPAFAPGPWTTPPGPLAPRLPEPWPTQEPARRVAPAEALPGGHGGRRTARRPAGLIGAGMLSAALVAAAGFGSAQALRSDGPRTAAGRTAANAAFELRLPAGWRRVSDAPGVPGVELTRRLTAAPAAPAGVRLVAGLADAEGPRLLARDGYQAARPARDPERVALGALQALRYRDLTIAARPATRLTLYAIPSDRGVATVACMAEPPAGRSSLAACERVATTLRLRAARALAIGPSAAYARSVTRTLGRLDRARRSAGRRLADARTAAGQARTAARVGDSYAAAARALSDVRVNPADRPSHRLLVTALRRTQRSFAALARAAGTGSADRYRVASRDVAGAVAGVDRAIRRLRSAGYTVSGA